MCYAVNIELCFENLFYLHNTGLYLANIYWLHTRGGRWRSKSENGLIAMHGMEQGMVSTQLERNQSIVLNTSIFRQSLFFTSLRTEMNLKGSRPCPSCGMLFPSLWADTRDYRRTVHTQIRNAFPTCLLHQCLYERREGEQIGESDLTPCGPLAG